MLDVHGAFTAIITPFSRDGTRIDFARLAAQIQYQTEHGVTGIVVAQCRIPKPYMREAKHGVLVKECWITGEIGKVSECRLSEFDSPVVITFSVRK